MYNIRHDSRLVGNHHTVPRDVQSYDDMNVITEIVETVEYRNTILGGQ